MITGFNTNVRHRGRLFHVQTEDSGSARPHIISHVYSGGTILASEKSDYAERVGSDDLAREVRVLMEAQHKAMISRLERGEFDGVIAERLKGAVAPDPAPVEPPAALRREPPRVGPTAARAAPGPKPAGGRPRAPAGPPERAFGEGIVSQRPLDELILDYLVQRARSSRSKG